MMRFLPLVTFILAIVTAFYSGSGMGFYKADTANGDRWFYLLGAWIFGIICLILAVATVALQLSPAPTP